MKKMLKAFKQKYTSLQSHAVMNWFRTQARSPSKEKHLKD